MVDQIISVDLETKENMKKIIDYLNIIYGDHTCCSEVLDEALELSEEIKKRMRVFKKNKESKIFSIRVNSDDSDEEITNKLNRIKLKMNEYREDKIVQT